MYHRCHGCALEPAVQHMRVKSISAVIAIAAFVGVVRICIFPLSVPASTTPKEISQSISSLQNCSHATQQWAMPQWATPQAFVGVHFSTLDDFVRHPNNEAGGLIFFSHIMKTGGTSLSRILRSVFEPAVCLHQTQESKLFTAANVATFR